MISIKLLILCLCKGFLYAYFCIAGSIVALYVSVVNVGFLEILLGMPVKT